MKKILITCIALFFYLIGFAQNTNEENDFLQEVTMQLVDVKDRHTQGQHKSPARIPNVAYDNQYIYVTSNYNISEIQVVICNETDTIIYNEYMTLISPITTIFIPKYIMNSKYSIELIFSEQIYKGFFQ